jgi:hypothetical protein
MWPLPCGLHDAVITYMVILHPNEARSRQRRPSPTSTYKHAPHTSTRTHTATHTCNPPYPPSPHPLHTEVHGQALAHCRGPLTASRSSSDHLVKTACLTVSCQVVCLDDLGNSVCNARQAPPSPPLTKTSRGAKGCRSPRDRTVERRGAPAEEEPRALFF